MPSQETFRVAVALNVSPNLFNKKEELQNVMVFLSMYSVFPFLDSAGLWTALSWELQCERAWDEGVGDVTVAPSLKAKREGCCLVWFQKVLGQCG